MSTTRRRFVLVRDSTKDIGANTVCGLCVSLAVDGIVFGYDVVVVVAVADEVFAVDTFWVDVIFAVVIPAEVVGGWEIGFGG